MCKSLTYHTGDTKPAPEQVNNFTNINRKNILSSDLESAWNSVLELTWTEFFPINFSPGPIFSSAQLMPSYSVTGRIQVQITPYVVDFFIYI